MPQGKKKRITWQGTQGVQGRGPVDAYPVCRVQVGPLQGQEALILTRDTRGRVGVIPKTRDRRIYARLKFDAHHRVHAIEKPFTQSLGLYFESSYFLLKNKNVQVLKKWGNQDPYYWFG